MAGQNCGITEAEDGHTTIVQTIYLEENSGTVSRWLKKMNVRPTGCLLDFHFLYRSFDVCQCHQVVKLFMPSALLILPSKT